MIYTVPRIITPLRIDGNADKPAWRTAKPLRLQNHMGDAPEHRPTVEARLLYDEQAIYVLWRVEDRYVRAVARQTHDPVCKDSCVEFFFTPETDPAVGYFNLETNCGGTMMFGVHTARRPDTELVEEQDCRGIAIAASLPKVIEQEIVEPTTWVLEYRLPLDLLERYAPIVRPAPGVRWRANFYKCASGTSHPHYLTWAPVEYPHPNFHLPEYFGTIVFE